MSVDPGAKDSFGRQLAEADFIRLARFIEGELGIRMPEGKRIMLESRLQKRLRALGLPGDPGEQVATALGELVAYLEFEIKNHPVIMEPDRLLAGLAELRSGAGA